MSTLFILLVLGAMVFVALNHSAEHALDDVRSIELDEAINHGKEWRFRLLQMACLMVLLWAFGWIISENWSAVMLFLPTVWAVWTINFRLTLNRGREFDWWYLGSILRYRTKKDSWYDTVFHFLAWVVTGLKRTKIHGHSTYPVRLPAILAYAFEVAVGLVGVWWAGRSVFGG